MSSDRTDRDGLDPDGSEGALDLDDWPVETPPAGFSARVLAAWSEERAVGRPPASRGTPPRLGLAGSNSRAGGIARARSITLAAVALAGAAGLVAVLRRDTRPGGPSVMVTTLVAGAPASADRGTGRAPLASASSSAPTATPAAAETDAPSSPSTNRGATRGTNASASPSTSTTSSPTPRSVSRVASRCRPEDPLCDDASQPLGPRGGGASPPVDGSLTQAQIVEVVQRERPAVRQGCWLSQKRPPDATARVSLSFTIESSGTVTGVRSTGDAAFPSLAPCVVERVRAWRFPASVQPTAVSVPFRFAGD